LDVDNAFLHGDLQEQVYMKVPEGVEGVQKGQVCLLLKSLYGLCQASKMCHERLTQFLIHQGFKVATSDPSMFVKSTPTSFTILLVYVDDLILAGNSMDEFSQLKNSLHAVFGIKDLGKLKYFLGLEVAHSSKGITLNQRKYCLDLLKDTGMLACKPIRTPLDPNSYLSADKGPAYEDVASYQRLVGWLLYLTNTRPDIAFATQQLSQFMSHPTQAHFNAAMRILRYLKNSAGLGLFFPRTSSVQLLGFSDADWGRCIDSRRSISGYCFCLGDSLVSWRAKK